MTRDALDRSETSVTLPRLIRRPSAFAPLAMSFAALATVGIHLAVYGLVRETDEGTAAHIWQLLMALQIPAIGIFATTWLPRALLLSFFLGSDTRSRLTP